jgi:hypothetical protein
MLPRRFAHRFTHAVTASDDAGHDHGMRAVPRLCAAKLSKLRALR